MYQLIIHHDVRVVDVDKEDNLEKELRKEDKVGYKK